jgi:hypothetical protein
MMVTTFNAWSIFIVTGIPTKMKFFIRNVGVPAHLDCDHKEHDEVICPQWNYLSP